MILKKLKDIYVLVSFISREASQKFFYYLLTNSLCPSIFLKKGIGGSGVIIMLLSPGPPRQLIFGHNVYFDSNYTYFQRF